MDRKAYKTLAEAERVARPEFAVDGDLLVVPPGNAIRSMKLPSLARMGLSCGRTRRSFNSAEAVNGMFRGGMEDAPIVLRLSDVRKYATASERRAQMLALAGNGREADDEAPHEAIRSCRLQLVYNGKDLPSHVDRSTAEALMNQRVGVVMERLQQTDVSLYSGPLADVAAELAWQAFGCVAGVVDGAKPAAADVPRTCRLGDSARNWDVGGSLGAAGRADVVRFLLDLTGDMAAPELVLVQGRFLAEAVKRGCAIVKCPQETAFAARLSLRAGAERCAEAWRRRARALEAMRLFALRDLAVAKARAANFDKIARKVADGRADHAFLQCMSGWDR